MTAEHQQLAVDDSSLTDAVHRLYGHVSHWTPPRWAASGASGASRGDTVYALVLRLAELAAEAEGQPRRLVPRPESDIVLPDQLRVIAADLVAAAPGPAVLAAAADLVKAAHSAL